MLTKKYSINTRCLPETLVTLATVAAEWLTDAGASEVKGDDRRTFCAEDGVRIANEGVCWVPNCWLCAMGRMDCCKMFAADRAPPT